MAKIPKPSEELGENPLDHDGSWFVPGEDV